MPLIGIPDEGRAQLARYFDNGVDTAIFLPVLVSGRTSDGQVVLQLRHRWTDGTTHVLFEPLELLERLAVLTLRAAQGHPEHRRGMTPRPRVNLTLYHGVPAPRAAWRSQIVGGDPPRESGVKGGRGEARLGGPSHVSDQPSAPARTWATLMRRVFRRSLAVRYTLAIQHSGR